MDLAYLKIRVHTLRQGLASRLKEYVSDFPTGTPKSVIDLLQSALGKIEHEINVAPSAQVLNLICQTIISYGRYLEYFDNAHTEQTPRALAQIIETLCKKLQPGAKIFVWPQAEYNYTIRDLLPSIKSTLENLLTEEDQRLLFQDFPVSINLVSFPRIERDDILLHAIFGHELGHPIADQFLSQESVRFKDKYEKCLEGVQQRINEQVQKTSADEVPILQFEKVQRITKTVHYMRRRGLEELISDVAGVYLFGPSALFAMYDIVLMESLDQLPEGHAAYPPHRYRLRLMMQILEREGYSDALKEVGNHSELGFEKENIISMLKMLKNITENKDDEDKIKSNPEVHLAYEWLSDTMEDAIAFTREALVEVLYDKERIKKEVPDLIARIAMGIPPNEINVYPNLQVVDWRSAILSAWLYKINGKKMGKKKEPEDIGGSDIERLQNITLRAVEHILLQDKYVGFLQLAE